MTYRNVLTLQWLVAGNSLLLHKGHEFATQDHGSNAHCAITYHGGWWFNDCLRSNLNGIYRPNATTPHADGIIWADFKMFDTSLKRTEMKIRPLSWVFTLMSLFYLDCTRVYLRIIKKLYVEQILLNNCWSPRFSFLVLSQCACVCNKYIRVECISQWTRDSVTEGIISALMHTHTHLFIVYQSCCYRKVLDVMLEVEGYKQIIFHKTW